MNDSTQHPEKNFELENTEVDDLQTYIKKRNTAVLTIMFTDLKGFTSFTEKNGDSVANEVRKLHDQTILRVIEERQSGKVIKFIGDAAMAVFSEPSEAVERSLALIRLMRNLFDEKEETKDLSIRIGLHMGQVVVDQSIQTDIFGRHVNRAARVEALADGDQIFLTYSVFDSAKGSLAQSPTLAWVSHGLYPLKGIPDPVEIFEVYDPQKKKPAAPKAAKKRGRVSLPLWTGIGALVAVFLAVILGGRFLLPAAQNGALLAPPLTSPEVVTSTDKNLPNSQAPVIELRGLPTTENVYIDNGVPLKTRPANNDQGWIVANSLKPGKHTLWTAIGLNLFAFPFQVEPGEKTIQVVYKKYVYPEYAWTWNSQGADTGKDRQELPWLLLQNKSKEVRTKWSVTTEVSAATRDSSIHFQGFCKIESDVFSSIQIPIDVQGDSNDASKAVYGDWKEVSRNQEWAVEVRMSQREKNLTVELRGFPVLP